jgi:hypothetical protein
MLAEPVHPTKVLLARSGMRYRGKRLRFNASHILATAENWLKLREYYESELMKSLNEAYPIDEEVLLERVGRLHPNFLSLFRLYGNKPRYNKREFENLKNLYYQAAFHMFVWISKASILSRKK